MARSLQLAITFALACGTLGSAFADPATPVPAEPDVAAESAAPPAPATEDSQPAADQPGKEQTLVDALVTRTGAIKLPGGKTRVSVGEGFAYLDARDAKTLIVDVFGNPPGAAQDVLGIILPSNVSPLHPDSWFAVRTHVSDRHVSDEDASTTDHAELLKTVQEETAEASKARVREGCTSMQLVGWVQKPSYDRTTHKVYWAK